jgi:hypothetical protein
VMIVAYSKGTRSYRELPEDGATAGSRGRLRDGDARGQ